MFSKVIAISIFFLSTQAIADLQLPRQLSHVDRLKTLEILGPALSTKVIGSPYSLGGFSGWEIGFSTSVLSTKDLAAVGSKPNTSSEAVVSSLTLGKGLFYNADMFLEFSPVQGVDGISTFGGSIRWTFWEAQYIPAYMVFQLANSSANIQNMITLNNTNVALIGAFYVNKITLYAGVGEVRTQGTFIGGGAANGLADLNQEGVSIQEEVQSAHSFAGLNFGIAKTFVALEIDRYSETTYSGRLGWRY